MPSCQCASTDIPGNLNPKDTPQFITLSKLSILNPHYLVAFDDAVNLPIWDTIQSIISNHKNPNGCPISSTFFVSTKYTDYWNVQQLYANGFEIAAHTMNHVSVPPFEESIGSYQALHAFSGIPTDHLKGFRTPFLNYSTQSFKTIHDSRFFLYDSSVGHHPLNQGFWPYTLDYGLPVEC